MSPDKGFLNFMFLSDPPKHHIFSHFPLLLYKKKYLQHPNLSEIVYKTWNAALVYYAWYINAVLLCLVGNVRKNVMLQELFQVM